MKPFVRLLEYPKAVLAVLFAVTVAANLVLTRLPMDFSAELMLESDLEGRETLENFLELFGRDDNLVIVAFETGEPEPGAGDLERITRITKSLAGLEGLSDVVSIAGAGGPGFFRPLAGPGADPEVVLEKASSIPAFRGSLISEDGRAFAALARIDDKFNNFTSREKLFKEIDMLLAQEAGVEFHVGGIPVFRSDIAGLIKGNLIKFFPIVTVIMGVLLFCLFRTMRGMMLPFLAVSLANSLNLAFLTITGGKIDILSSMIPTLVAVIGMSDSVHLISYYNELRALGRERKDAAATALKRVGAACALTTFTTMVGFASLYMVKMNAMKGFGLYAATGILAALFATLLLTPAALLVLKERKEKYPGALGMDGGPVIGHVNAIVQKFPAYVLLAGALMAATAVFGSTRLIIDTKLLEDVKSSHPLARTVHFLQDRLAGVLSIEVVIKAAPGVRFDDPGALAKIAELEERAEDIPNVVRVISLPDLISGAPVFMGGFERAPVMSRAEAAVNAGKYSGLMKAAPESALSGFVTDDWKKMRVSIRITDFGTSEFPAFYDQLTSVLDDTLVGIGEYEVTGTTRYAGDILSNMLKEIRRSFMLALVIIFIVMSLHFRSLRLGILSTIPNLIPIILTLGFMGLAGITLRISTSVTFVIAFCIAVDDTIHFLTHYRRSRLDGAPPRGAVEHALRSAGPAIIFTSIIMIFGFSALLFSDFTSTAHFGMLTMHIMFAALVGDLFILPALLILFDRKR